MNQFVQSPDLDEETYGLDEEMVGERRPDDSHVRRRPDATVKLYVALWLPGAGALLAYSILRGNFWVGFVGIELLLVGLYTLAKL